jgi:hypothetical protein
MYMYLQFCVIDVVISLIMILKDSIHRGRVIDRAFDIGIGRYLNSIKTCRVLITRT